MTHRPPRVRSDCLPGGINEARPCTWVTCRHNIAGDARGAGREWSDIDASCVLDLTDDRPSMTLEEVAATMGVTRERVRQIEAHSLVRIRIKARVVADFLDLLDDEEKAS